MQAHGVWQTASQAQAHAESVTRRNVTGSPQGKCATVQRRTGTAPLRNGSRRLVLTTEVPCGTPVKKRQRRQ
eukprot:73167-Rhodomonas_salina.1